MNIQRTPRNNLRPWFADEIMMVIRAIIFSSRETRGTEYWRGFLACAYAICLAIGVEFDRKDYENET